MIYLQIEKALVPSIMEVITELAIYRDTNKPEQYGQIYTLFKENDGTIRIGFTDGLNITKDVRNNSNAILLGSMKGSRRQEILLRATLLELGFQPKNQEGDYQYSKSLIRYLDLLNWPVGIITNSSCKNKS